ncbi:MAG: sensor histidine kinase KdpD [Myxococcales bacterium]|nr:sensor histidine kinase KdpD [Myxococcales bacterium]
MTDGERPDPDALLARVQAEEAPPRARLKIFFGAAPGVGKTFAMLESAQRLRAEGVDVVIGVIETHGRAETGALVAGLQVVPRRRVEHRGVALDELDLDAALARRPQVILVDELAHTNAPGSRHLKRWQDVLELLDAGVEVHTTLNVQHVASLTDVVEQITGVKVRETVPDDVLARADELELIDLAPEVLLERLDEGKVYLPEQARRATQHFFQKGNLLALRELALRRTAEQVDVDVQAYRRAHGIERPWAARERVLVAVGPSPSSERLIRAGKRTAERFDATWEVAAVDRPSRPLGARDRERLEAHLRLAESLGAEIVRLRDEQVAAALLAHARRRGVTRIVVGKPTHGRWRDLLTGGLVDALIRGSGEIEVHVVAPIDRDAPPPAPTSPLAAPPPARWSWAVGTLAVAAVTALGLAVFEHVTLADLAMLYVVAIMIAALGGRGPSLLAATLSVVAFDVCFVPPRFTLAVSDLGHLVTFAVMFVAGLAISALTTRLRRQEQDALVRERRTAAILGFTREIAAAETAADIAAVAVRHVEELLGVGAAVLVPEDAGDPTALTAIAGLMPLSAPEQSVAAWSLAHGQPAGHGTATLPGAAVTAVPLAEDAPRGVLVTAGRRDAPPFTADERHLLAALARQAGLALGRVQLATAARDASIRARTEELRSSLLSAVSHDLRTPLAVITGAATSLRDAGARLAPAVAAELLATIVDEARRLERVLQNLLSITRVETGLEPARAWVPVSELCGSALTRLADVLGDRAVELDVPDDLVVSVDPVLFEQVLINLVENAVKHGAPPIAISARRHGPLVELAVADAGAGVDLALGPRLFEKFFQAPGARPGGVGLGLAVCRGIVTAHGGTIAVERAPTGGARFVVRLPTPTPPALPALVVPPAGAP